MPGRMQALVIKHSGCRQEVISMWRIEYLFVLALTCFLLALLFFVETLIIPGLLCGVGMLLSLFATRYAKDEQ